MERKTPALGKEELEEFRQKTKDFYEGKITKTIIKDIREGTAAMPREEENAV